MVGKFSYWFFLYLKNIQLGYPQFTRLTEVLLNGTTIPTIKSSYDFKISKDKYKVILVQLLSSVVIYSCYRWLLSSVVIVSCYLQLLSIVVIVGCYLQLLSFGCYLQLLSIVVIFSCYLQLLSSVVIFSCYL